MEKEQIELFAKQKEDQTSTLYTLADKLATLAVSVLAITITFRDKMTPPGQPFPKPDQYLLALKLSWVCFIATVVGFVFIYIGKMDFHNDASKAIESPNTQSDGVIYFRPIFHYGRHLLIGGFLAGIILLAFYGFNH